VSLLLLPIGCRREPAAQRPGSRASTTMGDDIRTPPPGAYAKWGDNADSPLNADGTSANTTLLVRGADKDPVHVVIKAKARFGSLTEPLLDLEGDLAPQEELRISLDLSSTLDLHPEQYNYATRIKASVWFMSGDKMSGVRQVLDERYVVLSKADAPQAVSLDTLRAKYPWGITSVEELQRVQEDLERLPVKDGVLSGIEPGVYGTGKGADRRRLAGGPLFESGTSVVFFGGLP
jgi:hypothetical protein